MMTDKKFDKLMKDATDVLNKMPEAHNFSHRTVYNGTALTTSWYIEDSTMKELMGPNVGAWGNPNPVEKFVMDCERTINALIGALKEMANDYDSLVQQYNEYMDRQPDEKAKQLFDHVNGRGIQLIDILVDRDKAHLKVENQKMPEPPRPYCEGGWINANYCPNCGRYMNNEGSKKMQETDAGFYESEKSLEANDEEE